MDLAIRAKRSINSFFPDGTTPNEQRRIALLVLLSSIGIIFLTIFSIIAFLQGNPTLSMLDLLTAVILTLNLTDARIRKRFNVNIKVGTIFVSALFIYLYVSGGVGGTAFVWYYTYPLIACYLLGSRMGGIVSALMLIPVLALSLIAPSHTFFAQYSLTFLVRFLAAYVVTCFFAYFFERTREKNEIEIMEINQSLEELVSIRTQELAKSNELLQEDILKREIAEKALKESEQKYRMLAENATDIIWVLNLNTLKTEYVSPSIERIRGFTIDEAKSQSLEEQLSPESYQEVFGIIEEELLRENEEGVDKNRSRVVELEQSIKGGGYIWMEVSASFIRDSHGNPIAIMGVTRDIEARKKAESALLESEKMYRNLFENGSDLLCIHDLDGNLIETNLHYKKEYGWTEKDLSNFNIRDIIPSKYQNEFDRYIERLLKDGSVEGYFRGKTSSGQKVILEYRNNLITDSKGVAIAVQGAARDVTEKFKTEKAMRESEKRYRSVFEKSTDAIFIVDRKTGKYVDVNESGIQLTGRSRSELLQLSTQDVVPNGALERLRSVDESNSNLEFGKVTYVRPDGTQRTALLSSQPIDSENVIGIARDITEELVLAEQLRQTQKMEAIGTLAGGIAHDFNNILSAILGYAEMALIELSSDSSLKSNIESIYSAGERARDLVAQILTFSRKDEQTRLQVDLRTIIKDALKILRPAIPNTIEIQTHLESKGRVFADPSRIHQVIMNLCTNASQAMLASGGTIKISLSDLKMEGTAATNANIPDGNYVKLMVSDTGAGIPPEHLERVFDPFFTTKEVGKGTGLGLSVVHGIIERYEGSILVESEVGKGTTFEVYLPLSMEMDQSKIAQIDLTTAGNGHILLVDDEPDILEIETQMLKKLGYSITATNNPTAAIEIFAEKPEQFDLVITDMTMPTMTGDKLLIELGKILPDIPTILCTGYSELMSKEKATSLGVSEFLMKPISMADLSDTIRSVLNRKAN